MKKAFLAVIALALLVTSVPVAIGAESVVVGLALPTLREASWQFAFDVMQEYAKVNGIPMIAQAADANQAQQTGQVENMLTQGIDVLIIGPQDGDAAAVIGDMCKEEGVPVICYDRIITNTANVDYYVAINPRKLGELQGQFLADHAKPGAVMLFAGAADDSNSIHYFDGALSKMEPRIKDGSLKIIGGETFEQCVIRDWLPEIAQAKAEDILAANPDANVTAILSPNDGLAGGVIEALKANGVTGYVITGQDAEVAAIHRLKTGEQSMTIFVSAKDDLHTMVDIAVQAAKGEKIATNGFLNNGVIDVPAFLTDPIIMTKDNWKSLLEDNDLYDRAIHGD